MALSAPAEQKLDRRRRDDLVMAHVDLVRVLAARLGRRLPPQVEVNELVSVGVMGLIDAATRFQPSMGVPFDAFARRRIHGAMLDALRRLDWVPRSVRERRRALDAAVNRLRQTLGREPQAGEIAAEMGFSPADYDSTVDQIRSAELAALRTIDDGRSDLLDIRVDADDDQQTRLERRELRRLLAQALGRLPERERQILALSYVEEMTLAEIGRIIGVGESRISQLRTQAIARLRSRMTSDLTVAAT